MAGGGNDNQSKNITVDDKAGGSDDQSRKLDPTSPFFLGSQDNPGNIITHIQLRGENYDEWARSIRLSLRARRKFGFVDGSITKPTNIERIEDWQTVHSMIVSWIMNTIEPNLRSTISYYEDANLLWKDLKERLCVVNGPRIQQLKSSLADCKQSTTETVVNYYGRLKQLWDELANYELLPGCECGGCTCDLGAKLARMQEADRLHCFLMGLDVAYAGIRSNLLASDPLPTLNRAYQRVIQDERLRGGNFSRPKDDRDSVMALKIGGEIVLMEGEELDEEVLQQVVVKVKGNTTLSRGRGTSSAVREHNTTASGAARTQQGAVSRNQGSLWIFQTSKAYHPHSGSSWLNGPHAEDADWSG